jgi:hypothetical protein
VEHQGSQIRARFWLRWMEEGYPAAAVAVVRGTGRGSAALQGVGLWLFFYSRDRGRGHEVRDGVRRLRTSVSKHYRWLPVAIHVHMQLKSDPPFSPCLDAAATVSASDPPFSPSRPVGTDPLLPQPALKFVSVSFPEAVTVISCTEHMAKDDACKLQ